MAKVLCMIDHKERVAYSAMAFNVFDEKGREFGHQYNILKRRYLPCEAAPEHLAWMVDEDWAGIFYYDVAPHAMRDGKVFGAMPVRSRKKFKTLQQAIEYGSDCIERGRIAAQKKAVS